MNENLNLIVELFSKATEYAALGGVTWLVLDTVKAIFPWAAGCYIAGMIINRFPKVVKVEKKQ